MLDRKRIIFSVLILFTVAFIYCNTACGNTNFSLDKINKIKELYPDNYAGCYFDNNHRLNINYVGTNLSSLKKLLNEYNAKYHKVKYSYGYLNEINEKLCDNAIKLGISAVEFGEKDNRIYVYLKDINDNGKIQRIKLFIKSQAIVFRKKQGVTVDTDKIKQH